MDSQIVGNAGQEYDFVVVGGGNTGCVIAGRLSEDLSTSVLLLEAGESDESNPAIAVPGKKLSELGPKVDWRYPTIHRKKVFGKKLNEDSHYSMGKVLGGSTSVHAMHYLRGSPHDFDSWEDHGAEGWNFESVEPIFRKLENAKSDNMSTKYGRNGPVCLTRNHLESSQFSNLLTDAACELGFDYGDYCDRMNGLSYAVRTLYQGKRQNASAAYLRPHILNRRDRLHIRTGAQVTRILINEESATAYGVKYAQGNETYIVHALKEVVLCAGAFASPQLLLLSGIGPKEELEKFKIPVIKDLPGVGSNLQDFIAAPVHFIAENVSKLEDEFCECGASDAGEQRQIDYDATSFYLGAMSEYFDSAISQSKRERPFPDAAILIKQIHSDDKKLHFEMSPVLNHPKSTGTVRLKSGDPCVPPEVNTNYYGNEDDVKVHIAGFRLLEKFESSSVFKEAGVKFHTSNECSDFSSEEIPRSDGFYRRFIDRIMFPLNHACGTAKIGRPNDKYAVLDPQLRVYGIKKLRVADASVMPHIVTSSSQGPCYMIGEKASKIIKDTWGLR